MNILDASGNKWLGTPKTMRRRDGVVNDSHLHPRDLPPWNWTQIRTMLTDPTIRLGLAMRAAPLHNAQFAYKEGDTWVDGVKADKPEVGQFVLEQFQRIWKHELHKILQAQVWGWSGGEVTYRLKRGKVAVDRILHRHSLNIFALETHGDVTGVMFKGGAADKTGDIRLHFPECFWHSFNCEDENPYGQSILRGAYSPWTDKAMQGGATAVRRLFMYKDSFGGMAMRYPETTLLIDGKEVPARDVVREMVEQAKAGQVITLPSEIDPVSKQHLWDIIYAQTPGNVDHILQYPKDLDVEMLRGLEIPDDILMSEAGGAWQGKQVPMQAFYTAADCWLAQVIRTITLQIMEPLVLKNEGRAEEFEVTTKPLAEQVMDQIGTGATADGEQANPFAQQPGGQGPAQGGNGQPGGSFGSGVKPFGRFALDDDESADVLVGRGIVSAARMVEAGRAYLDSDKTGQELEDGVKSHRMAVAHAPKGGVTIGGKDFIGGEFIPGEVLGRATKEERAAIEGKGKSEVESGKAIDTVKQNPTALPAFRKWFGESKVVGDDGKPLIVEHLTDEDFTTFDKDRLGENTNVEFQTASQKGFFFADRGKYNVPHAPEPKFRKDVYLVMDNPLELDGVEPGDFDDSELRSGHDGIIFRNVFDGTAEEHTQYVVFEPNQIKAATGNKGTFDGKNPDTRE